MKIRGIISYRLQPPAPTIRSEDGATIETIDLYVVLHDPERLSLENYERILLLPSILGRDIINKYKLMYQAPSHEVYLER